MFSVPSRKLLSPKNPWSIATSSTRPEAGLKNRFSLYTSMCPLLASRWGGGSVLRKHALPTGPGARSASGGDDASDVRQRCLEWVRPLLAPLRARADHGDRDAQRRASCITSQSPDISAWTSLPHFLSASACCPGTFTTSEG